MRPVCLLRTIGVTLLLALALGCGSSAPDESEVLISLTDHVIVPGYEAIATEARDLSEALDALCAQPSEQTLSGAQQAWRDARAPWMRMEAMWFGPVMDRRAVGLIDWPKVDPERIEAMLADNPATSADDVRNRLASTQRGLGAVEYLLFAENALDLLSQQDSPRCEFLAALGHVVANETAAIHAAWTTEVDGRPPYQDFFTGRSSSSLITGQAVADVVRTQVFLIRTLVDMRLAAALGLREEKPDPSAVPGGNGDNALDDLRNEILGMRDVYLGSEDAEGLGISELVRDLSSETDDRMRAHFDEALAAIDAVTVPLHAALQAEPDKVKAVHESLAELRRTLNTEVVSLLGVAVGFSDTDGDSTR